MCILFVYVHLHLENVGLCTEDLRKSCHDLQTGVIICVFYMQNDFKLQKDALKQAPLVYM